MQTQNDSNRKRVVHEICFSAGPLLRDWGPRAQGQRPWAQGPQGLGPFSLNDSARWGFVLQLKLCCRLLFTWRKLSNILFTRFSIYLGLLYYCILCCAVWYGNMLHNIMLHYVVLYCVALHSIVLVSIVIHGVGDLRMGAIKVNISNIPQIITETIRTFESPR